ncbi:MAG: acyltransferase [Acidobacteriota bacterium]
MQAGGVALAPAAVSGRVPELDGLRGLAILLVLFHHSYPEGSWAASLGESGWIGVDLFFVLSGFLITGILLASKGSTHYYRNFVARRAIRIFPLYYVCLILFHLATKISGGAEWQAMAAWGGPSWFYFYLGNVRAAWEYALPPVFSFSILWSLQVEEQFYLLYPLAIARLRGTSLRRLLLACVFLAPVLRLLFSVVAHNPTASYALTFCRMDSLALGGLVAMRVRSGPVSLKTQSVLKVAARVAVLALLAAVLFGHLESSDPWVSTVGFSLIDLCCTTLLARLVLSPVSSLTPLLRWRPLVYTGQISYGLYLLHGPATFLFRSLVERLTSISVPPHSWLGVLILMVSSYVAAGLSWRFFESPLLSLKRRFTIRVTREACCLRGARYY